MLRDVSQISLENHIEEVCKNNCEATEEFLNFIYE